MLRRVSVPLAASALLVLYIGGDRHRSGGECGSYAFRSSDFATREACDHAGDYTTALVVALLTSAVALLVLRIEPGRDWLRGPAATFVLMTGISTALLRVAGLTHGRVPAPSRRPPSCYSPSVVGFRGKAHCSGGPYVASSLFVGTVALVLLVLTIGLTVLSDRRSRRGHALPRKRLRSYR